MAEASASGSKLILSAEPIIFVHKTNNNENTMINGVTAINTSNFFLNVIATTSDAISDMENFGVLNEQTL